MDPIISISYDFKSRDEEKRFILSCEDNFNRQVEECAERILESNTRFVMLSGPSCSGKTTASSRIVSAFSKKGVRVKVISIDDFYFSRALLEKRAKEAGKPIDFDSPATIDLEGLRDAMLSLRQGGIAYLPHYSFKTGERDRMDAFDASSVDIFLFEGIQAIYPEVLSLLSDEPYFSVYIRPASSIAAGGELFESHELRFARRLVRDFRYRSAEPDTTFMLWEGVRANEKEYLEPFEYSVDFRIDSTMGYEPAMIRELYLSYLSAVKPDSPYYERAKLLLSEYDHVPSLSSDFLPDDSIFREFIGKRGE